MAHIVVTGAGGFVGKDLSRLLNSRGHRVIALTRRPIHFENPLPTIEQAIFSDLEAPSNANRLDRILLESDVVIHLAAKVHDLKNAPGQDYFQANLNLTRFLVQRSICCNIKKFIFVSTTKVYGETEEDLTVESPCHPLTAYGQSKLSAEQCAIELCLNSSLSLDVVRVPLILDIDAKGNIDKLVKLVQLGLPIPFGNFVRPRSYLQKDTFISWLCQRAQIENFVDHSVELHLLADKQTMSTRQLVEWISSKLGRTVHFISIPILAWQILAQFCDGLAQLTSVQMPFGSEVLSKLYGTCKVTGGHKRLYKAT